MKKIISLLSVFAMIATLFTTVAFADENNYLELVEDSKTDSKIVLLAQFSTDFSEDDVYGFGFATSFKFPEAQADAIKVTKVDAISWNKAEKAVNGYYTVGGAAYIEEGAIESPFVLGKITIDLTKVTKNFTLELNTISVTNNDEEDDLTENYSTDKATYTVVVEPEEPEITINDKYVFNFTAEEGQDVMVTLKRKNGITSDLTYALPENVKGTASIFGLLKVVDDTVVSGDKFDIDVVDANRNVVKPITTITVD